MALDYTEVIDGVRLLFNNDFEQAEQIFATKAEKDPRYALHHAEAVFLRSFITADVEDTELALSRIGVAKQLAQDHIKLYEKGTVGPDGIVLDETQRSHRLLECRTILGDALSMLAVLQLTRDSKFKGAVNLRKSWKVFESCLKESKGKDYPDELVHCIQFGAGFFMWAISIVPQKFFKLISELIGFKSDRDLGLQYMKDGYNSKGIRSGYSSMVLLVNNLLLPRGLADAGKYVEEAQVLIDECLVDFPKGSLFQVMGSHAARKKNNISGGIQYLEDALENCKEFKHQPLIYKYELACCYAMKMEWQKAIDVFEELIPNEKFQVRALCALQLGTCYVMLGDTKKSAETFSKVPSLAKKSNPMDAIAARQAKRFVHKPHLSTFEVLYIRRDLAKMVEVAEDAASALEMQAAQTKALEQIKVEPSSGNKKLSSFLPSPFAKKEEDLSGNDADDRASYLMLKGSLKKLDNNHEEAVELYKEMSTLEGVISEKFYAPYAYYELGESYYHLKKHKEALEAMKKCSTFSGYDWEDPLKIRLRVTMDQLKKEGHSQ